jgi:hypothetical protein
VAQACLLCKHEALSSSPSLAKKTKPKQKRLRDCCSADQEKEMGERILLLWHTGIIVMQLIHSFQITEPVVYTQPVVEMELIDRR